MKFERNTVVIGCLGATVLVLGCALVAVLSVLLTGGQLPNIKKVAEDSPTTVPTLVAAAPTDTPIPTNTPPADDAIATATSASPAEPTDTPVPTNTPPADEATATVAVTPPPAADGPLKSGTMAFRYSDSVLIGKGLSTDDFEVGTIVHVLPGQVISDEFLKQELGTSGDETYYGETGINFDPQNPMIVDKYFTVAEIEPFVKFTEPFPENMRNGWNSYFQFDVEIFAPGTR